MKTAICAIIKDEHLYLQEWIEWHLDLGFDSIHLFEDKGSKSHQDITDKYKNVYLRRYEDDSEVQFLLKDQGKSERQLILYSWFAKTYKEEYDWIAFIDIDEYINFEEEYDINRLCDEYKDYSAVMLSWKMIGASGHIKRPNGSIVKNYTRQCGYLASDKNWKSKSFVNSAKYRGMADLHHAIDAVNIDLSVDRDRVIFKKAWINHYFTKSWEDWCDRIFKRGGTLNGHRTLDVFFQCNIDMLPFRDVLEKPLMSQQPKNCFWFDREKRIISGGNLDLIRRLNGEKEEKKGKSNVFLKPVEGVRFGNILFMLAFAEKINYGGKIIVDESSKEINPTIFKHFCSVLRLNDFFEYGGLYEVNADFCINNEDISSDIIIPSWCNKFALYGYFQELPNPTFVSKVKSAISSNVINDYVVVHVRRTDFMDKNNERVHPVMSVGYYNEAMNLFDVDSKFMFISDDIKWCEDNFKGDNICYSHGSDIDDFNLLLGAKSVIFGNSTFAYWGAILNINPQCKVVCNRNWYTERSGLNHCCEKLFPSEWKLLNFKYE